MENRKVTDALRDRSIRCAAHRPFRRLSDRVSRFSGVSDPSVEYDMKKSEVATLSCFDLMSEVMHSYIFIAVVDKNDIMVGFFVNSYKKRDDRLLFVDRKIFEGILIAAIQDEVMMLHIFKHPKSDKVLAKVSGRKPSRLG
ncbi:hypothetical protein [Tardiphaga sp. OK246]|jgi:hypothetical protein|uniref:hypothetical protein n=1 Tax=Tardiphaga sp. OK246 TaxID=1855307 RepID=UPI00113268E8|nr:hypothetical protein [Tardiphaga sp. OK246]